MPNPGNIIGPPSLSSSFPTNTPTGGHKANLNNPNTSSESKQHSKEVPFPLPSLSLPNTPQVLEKEFGGGDTGKYSAAGSHGGTKNSKNVEGGLKATMKNPNTSEEAKMHAKERLESGDL
jgi:hypothetical protein